jgi:release factor glutamine methyltransferase
VPDRQFDLIISNPPYIEQDDPCLKDLIHEPQTALVSGKDGLDDIRIIIKQAPQHLTNNGFLLLEHGYNQQLKIVDLLTTNFHSCKPTALLEININGCILLGHC